jgi:hypothetical protein
MSDIIDQIPEIPPGASSVPPGTLAKGVPFDPARHIPRTNPKTGAWMPKGGRKPKTASESSGSTSSQPGSTEPAQPELFTPSDTSPIDSPAAPSFEDIEKAAGPVASETPSPAPGAAPSGDATLPAEAAGEIGARAVYAITGAVIGNHKAATASGAEHKNITAVITAYAKHRGWAAVGLVALIGTLVAYLLTDGRREPLVDMIKRAIANAKKKPAAMPVTPEAEPIDIAPAPAAAPAIPEAHFEKI